MSNPEQGGPSPEEMGLKPEDLKPAGTEPSPEEIEEINARTSEENEQEAIRQEELKKWLTERVGFHSSPKAILKDMGRVAVNDIKNIFGHGRQSEIDRPDTSEEQESNKEPDDKED